MSKDLLKILTCGSVDDGKSTLLGRILFDSKNVFSDQLHATENESKKYGTHGKNTDLALLVDGLQAEREQGITIDVAYRYFKSKKRKFIVADCPGHEQYTRNMATGASNSDLAIILVDAKKGLLDQTKRHSFIVSLLGIKQVIIAVNKMDKVKFNKKYFSKIKEDYLIFSKKLKFKKINFIPISALRGDNIYIKSKKISWYKGGSLMNILDNTDILNENSNDFRLPVQWVNRPKSNFRGYSGLISSGRVNKGMEVLISPSDKIAKIKKILGPSGYINEAKKGQSVTVLLNKEIDISRGDCISSKINPITASDQFTANIIWMDKSPLISNHLYTIKFTASSATAQITKLNYKFGSNLNSRGAKKLDLNDIGYCNILISKKITFDSYSKHSKTGSFILIDKITNHTVGAGVVDFAIKGKGNIFWQTTKINKNIRSSNNSQKPCVIWFTGLSGSGKSTVSDLVENKLQEMGKKTYLLDGNNVRHGLNKDLGFTDKDRIENIRRVSEVSKLMVDAGLIVLVSFISPFRSDRDIARAMLDKNEFIEVFVDTSLKVCEKRDPKGLYKKARTGKLKNFTGISSKYEKPINPEIILKGDSQKPEMLSNQIIRFLKENDKI